MTDALDHRPGSDDTEPMSTATNPPKTLHRMPKSSSLSMPSGERSGSVGDAGASKAPTSGSTNSDDAATNNNMSFDSSTTTKEPPRNTISPPPKSPASPSQFKTLFTGGRQGKSQIASSQAQRKNAPAPVSVREFVESTTPTHPYGRSPNSSAASLSHGNLLETASITSGSVADSNAEEDRKANNKQHKFQNILGRTRSIKGDDSTSSRSQQRLAPSSRDRMSPTENPRTAPLDQDRSFREMMDSSKRNRSADRMAVESEDETNATPKPPSSRIQGQGQVQGQGPGLLSNFVHSSTKAADGLGKAGNRFFGKFTRSGSSHEREVLPENYTFKVINMPLVEQTRLTRLKKNMDLARDKTEFWMPALPYRCIDFLNHHGVEVEGLYRIPGSGREVKQWQMRFDTGPNYDVDLLDDNIELYDINVVGSMLKAWLRDLPEDLLPKPVQSKISTQCKGAEETPQLMRDELSKLPPFNYYLLFAITCHISLLHSHSDKNKMNFHNLCVCFQPSLKVDGFCFQFLVMDWRNCWQGCWTEKETLVEESQIAESRARGGNSSHSVNDPPSRNTTDRSAVTEGRPPSAPPKTRSPSNGQIPSANRRQEARTDKNKENLEAPFSQDFGSRHFAADKRSSTPPSLQSVSKVSPMRM